MKNLKLFLCLALATGLNAINRDETPSFADDTTPACVIVTAEEPSMNDVAVNYTETFDMGTNQYLTATNNEMLPKIQLFQEFSKACPRVIDSYQATTKGIVEYSSEPEEIKNCSRSFLECIQEAQTITTEEQAQLFATKFTSAINECKNAAERDFEATINDAKKNQLPFIKVAQRAVKAFPNEIAIAVMQSNKEDAQFLIQSFQELTQVTTEEQAQVFTAKLAEKREIQEIINGITQSYEIYKAQTRN